MILRLIQSLCLDFSSPLFAARYNSCTDYSVPSSYKPTSPKSNGALDVAVLKMQDKFVVRNNLEFRKLRLCTRENYFRCGTVIGLGLTNQNDHLQGKQLVEAEMAEIGHRDVKIYCF